MNALVAPYHSTEFDASKCVGRRAGDEDRHWSTFVFSAHQCKNAPVSGSDICETCQRHLAAAVAVGDPLLVGERHDWNGRVTDNNLDSLPRRSHIAGSVWFHESTASGKLIRREEETPRSARKAAGLPRAPRVPDLELTKFLRGDAPHLNIEELSGAARQISGQQLRDMLCSLYGKAAGAEEIGKFTSKPKMCAEIRRMMVAGAVPDPRFRAVYPKELAPAPAPAPAPAQLPPEGAAAGAASPAEDLIVDFGALLEEAETRAAVAEESLAAVKAELAALKAAVAALIA